jgi:hypothetical protein
MHGSDLLPLSPLSPLSPLPSTTGFPPEDPCNSQVTGRTLRSGLTTPGMTSNGLCVFCFCTPKLPRKFQDTLSWAQSLQHIELPEGLTYSRGHWTANQMIVIRRKCNISLARTKLLLVKAIKVLFHLRIWCTVVFTPTDKHSRLSVRDSYLLRP